MTEKLAGTADVTVVVWVAERQDSDHMLARFGAGARARGTLAIVSYDVEPAPHSLDPGFRVRLRYRHTCKNQGNHEWDAKRFFDKTFPVGTDDERFAVLEDVVLNDWQRVS